MFLTYVPYVGVRLQKTHASHALQDDVSAGVKQRRLEELIATFRGEAAKVNSALLGSTQLVLVEGVSTAARQACHTKKSANSVKIIIGVSSAQHFSIFVFN